MVDTGPTDEHRLPFSSDVDDAALEAALGDVAVEDAAAGLAAALWVEREALEVLLYQLLAQRQVAETGQTRWFKLADSQVRAALETLQYHELARAAETEALVRALRLDARAPLRQLVDLVAQPWSTILDEHRAALSALWAEVERMAEDNRVALAAVAAERQDEP